VRHTTAICLLVTLSAALFASPALASDEDTQFWLSASVTGPLADDVSGSFDLSQRWRDGPNQLFARASADYKATPWLNLGGGATWVAFAGGHEFRPHEQATITVGRLAFRSRAEERFFAGADRMQLRLRERVQLTEPVVKDTNLIAMAELLYIARPENRTSDARIDAWRFAGAIQHKFSSCLDGTLGYMLSYGPRAGAPDKISHIPQASLTLHL